MRKILLVALLGALACKAPDRAVVGAWYELRLPSGWVEMPRESAALLSSAEAAWMVPPAPPLSSLILARPVAFEGSAEQYAGAQAPSLKALGLTAAPGHEDLIGRLPVWVVDATGRQVAMRYWFFVKDGTAGMLQCFAPETERLEPCLRIANSFRVTGAIPRAAAAAAAGPPHDLEIGGYRPRAPAGWSRFDTATENAVWVVRSGTMAGRLFPSALLSVEPTTLSLDGYHQAGTRQLAAQNARVDENWHEGKLLGLRAIVSETLFPLGQGGHRAVQVETVKDGVAYVLTCAGDPDAFAPAREACDLIASSLTAPEK